MDTEEDALPEGQDTFDRAYVEKLREEAARYRTSLKPYKAAFGDFNDAETEFLFEMLTALNKDPHEGARMFRDMSKNILNDEFFEGLDLPVVERPEEESDTVGDAVDEIVNNKQSKNKDENMAEKAKEKESSGVLTPEQLRAELDARDKAAAERAAEAAAEAKMQAEIEAVYKEIEDAGFQRGTEAFQTALSLGASMTQQGKDVVFADLAKKVRFVHDMPEPEAAPDPEPAAPDPMNPTGSGKEFAKTATVEGVATPTEPAKDWVQEAKEKGINPMQAARERAEARLNQGMLP